MCKLETTRGPVILGPKRVSLDWCLLLVGRSTTCFWLCRSLSYELFSLFSIAASHCAKKNKRKETKAPIRRHNMHTACIKKAFHFHFVTFSHLYLLFLLCFSPSKHVSFAPSHLGQTQLVNSKIGKERGIDVFTLLPILEASNKYLLNINQFLFPVVWQRNPIYQQKRAKYRHRKCFCIFVKQGYCA